MSACEKCGVKNGCAVELCPNGLDVMLGEIILEKTKAETRKKSAKR